MTRINRKIFPAVAVLTVLFLAHLSLAQVDERWKPNDESRPVPPIITPGTSSDQKMPGKAPSDAVVLFDGTSLSQWAGEDNGPAKWKVEHGYVEVVPKTGYIHTK